MSRIQVKATLRAIDFGNSQVLGTARFQCEGGLEVSINTLTDEQLRQIGPGYGVLGAFTFTLEGPTK